MKKPVDFMDLTISSLKKPRIPNPQPYFTESLREFLEEFPAFEANNGPYSTHQEAYKAYFDHVGDYFWYFEALELLLQNIDETRKS